VPTFPRPFHQGYCIYFLEHELQSYINELVGAPPVETPPPSQFKLIKSRELQARIGLSRRSVLRRIAEADPSAPGARAKRPGSRKLETAAE